jgi:hypothetical protein
MVQKMRWILAHPLCPERREREENIYEITRGHTLNRRCSIYV